MSDDFSNGLSIVPLRPGDQWMGNAAASPPTHPFGPLLVPRANAPTTASKAPESGRPPASYKEHSLLRAPGAKASGGDAEVHETVRLADVEAFRLKTAVLVRGASGNDMDRQMADRIARLRLSNDAVRPVIYRYVDVVKGDVALLEAIHFELFMPDRPDLRFLAVPLTAVPRDCVEGDYLQVTEASLLHTPRGGPFAVKLHRQEYPVVWEARAPVRMSFRTQKLKSALAYIMKSKQVGLGGDRAISILAPDVFLIRTPLFAATNSNDRGPDRLLRVSMRPGASAHLYPVEPPRPPSLPGAGDGVVSYISAVRDVRTSSQRETRLVVAAVAPLTDEQEALIEDRLGPFRSYGTFTGDVVLMDELFQLGCRLREIEARGDGEAAADAGELRVDESVILKSLVDEDAGSTQRARALLDAIYGRGRAGDEAPEDPPQGAPAPRAGAIRLNVGQSRALHYYTMDAAPRVFCILSPPGSGKTTVAAAMAAAVAKNVREAPKSFLKRQPKTTIGDVQLLLSVQNVAVDNMGAALKKMEYGGGLVYNMKSTSKMNPHDPAPFDFFDLAGEDSLKGWRTLRGPMEKEQRARTAKYSKAKKVYEDQLTTARREYEKNLSPKIIMSTVEMVLTKMFTNSKLCEALKHVTRVIVDEASLLTEAALFCILRRFPEAQLVLIGDDKQLPPFMYDPHSLGSDLAGRPALTVAMKTGRVPVVELTEVYRAPQSLIAPYNRLAYDNRLRSKMPEGDRPLAVLRLLHASQPQLLFVDVADGKAEREEKSRSLYNDKELAAFRRLLAKFPHDWKEQIMIICLYKEQKRRLQAVLDRDFSVLTVDSAQGKEKPIVILLTTRTEIPKQGHFFDSQERCNVAVSRQQKALIVFGKGPLLTTRTPWSTVVNGDDFTRIKAEDIK